MKTYYLCDLTTNKVVSGGELPETFANRINPLRGLEDEYLTDLGQLGVDGWGFLSYDAAVEAGMDEATLSAAHDSATGLAWLPIQEHRDHLMQTTGWKVGDLWFHSDAASRNQYITYLQLALENNLASTYVLRKDWKTMSGELVDMTVDLMRQVRASGIHTENTIYDAAVAHRAAMESSDDPLGYDFSGNWPVTFYTKG